MQEDVEIGKSLDPSAQLSASAPSRGGLEVEISEKMSELSRGRHALGLISHKTGRTHSDQEGESKSAGVLPGSMGQCSSRVARSQPLELQCALTNSLETTLSEEDWANIRSCVDFRKYLVFHQVDCEKLIIMVNDYPELLLQNGNEEGRTLLHVAVIVSSEELVDKLLEVAFKAGPRNETARQLLHAVEKNSS